MLRAPLPTTLNYNLAIHSNDSFWIVQKDQASLSAVRQTTPRRPVQTGRLRRNHRPPLSNREMAGCPARKSHSTCSCRSCGADRRSLSAHPRRRRLAAAPTAPPHAVPGWTISSSSFARGFTQSPGVTSYFKDRKLHALAVILTGPGDPPQAPAPCRLGRVHVLAHHNQHCPKPAKPEPNKRSGRNSTSAVRAILDDPPIHIRPNLPAARMQSKQTLWV